MSSNNTGNAQAEQGVTLESVSIGMKRQKKQLLVLSALCALAFPSGLLALVLLMTSTNAEPVQETFSISEMRALQSQLADLETRLNAAITASAQSQEELAALSRQVGAIDVTDSRNAVQHVQQLLVRQEQDYQKFLTTLEGGLYNFHMMIPHSRGWWDAYTDDLQESVELSKTREMFAAGLFEIEPQGINQ